MATHRATLPSRHYARPAAGTKKPPAAAPARRAGFEPVACAASRSRQGQSTNQDAYFVQRAAPAWVAVADGEGEAATCAKRALQMLSERLGAAAGGAEQPEPWRRWQEEIAAALHGGPGCAWAAALVAAGRVVGAAMPGLRAAILAPGAAACRWLSDGTEFTAFDEPLRAGEACLLFTDGAWRALGPGWETMLSAMENAWCWPATLLDLASREGRADDMTVALLRRG